MHHHWISSEHLCDNKIFGGTFKTELNKLYISQTHKLYYCEKLSLSFMSFKWFKLKCMPSYVLNVNIIINIVLVYGGRLKELSLVSDRYQ